jgi:hypothetical protein
MEIILSPILSVYTDGITPLAIRSVYTDGNISSIYTDRIADGLYSLFGKMQRCGDVEFFQTILPTEWPRDSNWDSRIVTWHFHWRNHRRERFVSDSIGKSHYIRTSSTDTLFLCFSLFFPFFFLIPSLPSQTKKVDVTDKWILQTWHDVKQKLWSWMDHNRDMHFELKSTQKRCMV